jgi:hypothetical protein
MKKAVWISYDLGVKGDYEGLYFWLDVHGAIECSGTTAFVSFDTKSDLVADLKKSVKEAVEIDAKSRIYIIFRAKDKQMKGRFLFGGRKAAPWAGFAPQETTEEVEDGG